MLAIHVEKMVEAEGLSGLPWAQVESNEHTSGPAQTYDLTATLSFNSKDLRVGRRKRGYGNVGDSITSRLFIGRAKRPSPLA